MGYQPLANDNIATKRHQDVEFEIGALASRHALPLDVARMIVERCGDDMDCIDDEARAWKLTQ